MVEASFICNDKLKQQLMQALSLKETNTSQLLFYEIIDHKIDLSNTKDIIFLSNDEQDVFKTLIYQPLYFIRINKLEEDLQQVAFILKNKYQPTLNYNLNGINVDILISSIIYIESYGHYLTIVTTAKKYKIRENISTIIKKLPNYFERVHKSYIINKNLITRKNSSEIILYDMYTVPLGRSYKA